MTNLIFEFAIIYVTLGMLAYILFIVCGTIYAAVSLYPNVAQMQRFRSLSSYKTSEKKNDGIFKFIWNYVILWPYRITMAAYILQTNVNKAKTET